MKKSGGFGTVLLLGHNCANPEATRKSYELIARNVMSALNRANASRVRSMAWATKNAGTFMPAFGAGIEQAIVEHEQERAARGGAGTPWRG
jgi:limonene 1,2-monooxygenase